MTAGKLPSSPLWEMIGSSVPDQSRADQRGPCRGDMKVADRAQSALLPGCWLGDDEQLSFARTLGEVSADRDMSADMSVNRNGMLPDYQMSSVHWHFDGFGGATELANCHAGWGDLRQDDKKALDGLRVRHSFETLMRLVKPKLGENELQVWRQGSAPQNQPLVWHHNSGQNSMLLGDECQIRGEHACSRMPGC